MENSLRIIFSVCGFIILASFFPSQIKKLVVEKEFIAVIFSLVLLLTLLILPRIRRSRY